MQLSLWIVFRHIVIVCLLYTFSYVNADPIDNSGLSRQVAAELKIDPDPKNSAMFRWWLPAAKVDFDVIEKQLQEVASKGFKGVEICIHMGDSQYLRSDMQTYGWGSSRWNMLYKHILKTANALGLQVDTTISPAWPAAVPSISPSDKAASHELRFGQSEVFSHQFNGPIPLAENIPNGALAPPPGAPPTPVEGEVNQVGPNGMLPNDFQVVTSHDTLVGVGAVKLVGKTTINKDLMIAWGDMPHVSRQMSYQATLIDPKQLIVIDSYTFDPSSQAYTLNWVPPDSGQWQIISYWSRGTGQQNKEGVSTASPNYVVDHIGYAGAEALIEFWESQLLDQETKDLLRENGGAIFEDSLELDFKGVIWNSDLLSEFKRQRGYDLMPYLPLLVGGMYNGLAKDGVYLYELISSNGKVSKDGDRIRRDFNELLTQLYIEQHINPIQTWATSLGLGYRAQAYGLAADIVRTSAAALGPDGESLGFGPSIQGDDRFRMIAGGANLASRSIVADEVGAMANEGYRQTWLDMLKLINKNLSAGANQMIFHGMPYTDSNVSIWPGVTPFGFGLAGYWGDRNPSWSQSEALAHYIARAQSILQTGRSLTDLAVVTDQYGTSSPVLLNQALRDKGYSYDILTSESLSLLSSNKPGFKQRLMSTGYKAFIVNDLDVMSVNALESLIAIAQEGLPVIFVGKLPSDVPYFHHYQNNKNKLISELGVAIDNKMFDAVTSLTSVLPLLKQKKIQQSLPIVAGAPVMVRGRHHLGHGDYFFVHNRHDANNDVVIKIPLDKKLYRHNLWTGQIIELVKNDKSQAILALNQDEAVVLIVTDEPIAINELRTKQSGSRQLTDWSLTLKRWSAAKNKQLSSATQISNVNLGMIKLEPWSNLLPHGSEISGIGFYETTFDLTQQDLKTTVQLMIENWGDSDSVTVFINNQKVDFDFYAGVAVLNGWLKQKNNNLRIEVASTLGNQLIANGKITAPIWDPSFTISPEKYGLQGRVFLNFFETY